MKTQAMTLYPFVPSGPNFARSLGFFAELGFEKVWQQGGYAGLRFGGAYFILQEIDAPQWANNQMIVYEVLDLDAYWAELQAKDLASQCGSEAQATDGFSVGPRSSHRRSNRSLLARAAGEGVTMMNDSRLAS